MNIILNSLEQSKNTEFQGGRMDGNTSYCGQKELWKRELLREAVCSPMPAQAVLLNKGGGLYMQNTSLP